MWGALRGCSNRSRLAVSAQKTRARSSAAHPAGNCFEEQTALCSWGVASTAIVQEPIRFARDCAPLSLRSARCANQRKESPKNPTSLLTTLIGAVVERFLHIGHAVGIGVAQPPKIRYVGVIHIPLAREQTGP